MDPEFIRGEQVHNGPDLLRGKSGHRGVAIAEPKESSSGLAVSSPVCEGLQHWEHTLRVTRLAASKETGS